MPKNFNRPLEHYEQDGAREIKPKISTRKRTAKADVIPQVNKEISKSRVADKIIDNDKTKLSNEYNLLKDTGQLSDERLNAIIRMNNVIQGIGDDDKRKFLDDLFTQLYNQDPVKLSQRLTFFGKDDYLQGWIDYFINASQEEQIYQSYGAIYKALTGDEPNYEETVNKFLLNL